MPKKPKRRTVASYRAASLKGARSKRKMREQRISDIGLQQYRDKLREKDMLWEHGVGTYKIGTPITRARAVFDDMLPPEPTINRVPRPEPVKT